MKLKPLTEQETLWIGSYFDGDNHNWLMFIWHADAYDTAETQFCEEYRNEYGADIDKSDIYSVNQVKTLGDYQIIVKKNEN